MYFILRWNQTLLIFHKRAHNTKQWYMNQNIHLIKIYNFYIIFPMCKVLKRNCAVFYEILMTGAHLSTLVLTAFDYPVTTIEAIYFYFHPAIAESIPVLYTVFRHLFKCYSCIWVSTLYFYNHNTLVKHCIWYKTAIHGTLPQDSCLMLATKYSFHSMKDATSQCTMNKTQAQTTSCSL
jgi:hypothetical protein